VAKSPAVQLARPRYIGPRNRQTFRKEAKLPFMKM
jgi:hypothetical protein